MESKYSEQAPMSIGWYEAEIKRIQSQCDKHEETIAAVEGAMELMKEENERLKELVQVHQTYETKQGDKS
jgi:uncharacterized protein Yka (UPF0111/DUF47 family)